MENNNLYPEIYNLSNLILAWRKARTIETTINLTDRQVYKVGQFI